MKNLMMQEVYVNTGSLWIEKTADHYEWKTGEQVEYRVVVENKNQGTIARNVTVWDTEMPAGLVLDSMEMYLLMEFLRVLRSLLPEQKILRDS